MAKKFKINDRVRVIATGESGVVKGREILPVEGSKRVNIEYIVKVGDGFSNWKTFSKKELESVRKEEEEPRVYTKVYDVVDGYKITLFAKVYNHKGENDFFSYSYRELKIGYSIYNPDDEYNEQIGVKIARKRSRLSPFCRLTSDFNGEFNKETVEAIMDVKATYIKNHFDKFIQKQNK